jgi:HEAT repeats
MEFAKMKTAFIVFLFFCAASLLIADEQVLHFTGSAESLAERWKWGIQQGTNTAKDDFWVGYSFVRLMPQNELIGSWYGDHKRRKSFQEVLGGPPVGEMESKSSAKVERPIAVLFKYDRTGRRIECVTVSSFNLHVDLQGAPVVWLGEANPSESLKWLSGMYQSAPDEDSKQNVIDAIGIHHTREILPILQPLLSERSTRLRAQAAFWIGNLDDPQGLDILKRFLSTETSEEVLNQAMAGMNESGLPAATEALNEWAEKSDNRELRKQAIFWLAQKAARNVQQKIKDIAFNDKDTQIQKQAVAALAEMEDGAGIPQLIEIARTHPNPEVKKAAIIFLGEAEDPRARQALLDIIKE